jgi:hypothetical protein
MITPDSVDDSPAARYTPDGAYEARKAGTSRSWQSMAKATEMTSPLQHGTKNTSEHQRWSDQLATLGLDSKQECRCLTDRRDGRRKNQNSETAIRLTRLCLGVEADHQRLHSRRARPHPEVHERQCWLLHRGARRLIAAVSPPCTARSPGRQSPSTRCAGGRAPAPRRPTRARPPPGS